MVIAIPVAVACGRRRADLLSSRWPTDTASSASQTARIGVIDRVVMDVGLPVQPIAIADGVGLEKPPQRGRIGAGLVMIGAEVGQPDLADELEAAAVARAGMPYSS